MNKWTRANPLAAVPGYKVPRGHYANGYTNGGDRVGFRKGGTVGLKKGGRTKRQAAASEIFKAKGLKKAGETRKVRVIHLPFRIIAGKKH